MTDAQGVGAPPQGENVNPGGAAGGAGLSQGGAPDDKERLWGMLAHLSNIPLPILGPLVIMLMPEALVGHPSEFVKHAGKQALIFEIVAFVLLVVLSIVTCGFGGILFIVPLIFSVLGGLAAHKGEWYTYPGLKRFSDR